MILIKVILLHMYKHKLETYLTTCHPQLPTSLPLPPPPHLPLIHVSIHGSIHGNIHGFMSQGIQSIHAPHGSPSLNPLFPDPIILDIILKIGRWFGIELASFHSVCQGLLNGVQHFQRPVYSK